MRNLVMVGRLLLIAPLLVVRATPTWAHAVGMSRGEYRAAGNEIRADLVFARQELLVALPGLDRDHNGDLTSDELAHGQADLGSWLQHGIAVRVPSGACVAELGEALLTEQDGVQVPAHYRCPDTASSFSVRLELLAQLSLGHRHVLTATTPERTEHAVLYEAQPELTLAPPTNDSHPPAVGSVGPALFRLGVEHILTGYDHLLFLLALVLVGGSLRAVAGVVTAFTLAHSVTLAVAALGWWTPRPTLVEPAIALSIAYVGIENCFAPDLRQRWRLTFLFGLVHGFGFAGALKEIALAPGQLPLALASFNLGVEAGQFAVLALVRPIVSWLTARAWFAHGGLQVSSIAISAMGMWWFIVRIAGG